MKKNYEETMDNLMWKLGNAEKVEEINSLLEEARKVFSNIDSEERNLFYDIWIEAIKAKIARLVAEKIMMSEPYPIAKPAMEKVAVFISLGDTMIPNEKDLPKSKFSIKKLEEINRLISHCGTALSTNEAGVVSMFIDLLDAYRSILDASSMSMVRRHLLSDLQKFVLEQGEQLNFEYDEIGYWKDFSALLQEDKLSKSEEFLSNVYFDKEQKEFGKCSKAWPF